jgi:hypothetical protein
MEANMRIFLAALALSCSFGAALAAGDPPAGTAPRVAEMLQRRQESQLREHLAREGRWDEVHRMDEEQLRRQQVRKKQTIIKLNAELAREGKVETTVNGDGVVSICAPAPVPARAKADAAGTDTSYVR